MIAGVQTAVGNVVWHENRSTDVEKATWFYKELLGWKIETWKPGQLDYAIIKVDGQAQGGFGTVRGGAPPHWLACVLVHDVDATARRAWDAGGKVLPGPFDSPQVGRMAVIADPQTAVFGALASAGEAKAGEGTFVWDELLTSDVEAARSFYGEVFGWTTRDIALGERGTYSIFENAGAGNVAGCMKVPEGVQVPPHWRVHIATKDVDAAVDRAKELGGTAFVEGMDIPNVGRIAVLQDPVGAVFCLYT